jgi:hypothetical protein
MAAEGAPAIALGVAETPTPGSEAGAGNLGDLGLVALYERQ